MDTGEKDEIGVCGRHSETPSRRSTQTGRFSPLESLYNIVAIYCFYIDHATFHSIRTLSDIRTLSEILSLTNVRVLNTSVIFIGKAHCNLCLCLFVAAETLFCRLKSVNGFVDFRRNTASLNRSRHLRRRRAVRPPRNRLRLRRAPRQPRPVPSEDARLRRPRQQCPFLTHEQERVVLHQVCSCSSLTFTSSLRFSRLTRFHLK